MVGETSSTARRPTRAAGDLLAVAHRVRDICAADSPFGPADLAQLAHLEQRCDPRSCRAIADRFERRPRLSWSAGLQRQYAVLTANVRLQYEELRAAGLRVEPWTAPGEPYRGPSELAARVWSTATVQVTLTRDRHGPAADGVFHPLREPSGVVAGGVELAQNDLLRVVHDVFGHALFGYGFDPAGELAATYCQMALSSADARPVLFSEQVAQTCWFFFGPHLRGPRGHIRRQGEPGYVPPHRRPYPEQKVFPVSQRTVTWFARKFECGTAPS